MIALCLNSEFIVGQNPVYLIGTTQQPIYPNAPYNYVNGVSVTTLLNNVACNNTTSNFVFGQGSYKGAYVCGLLPAVTNPLFKINFSYDVNPVDGVTTYDLLLIQKHILAITPFNSWFQILSADANELLINNISNVTTQDIVTLRNLILGLTSVISSGVPSWRFVPSGKFENPQWVSAFQANPLNIQATYPNTSIENMYPSYLDNHSIILAGYPNSLQWNFQYIQNVGSAIAIKKGDVNSSNSQSTNMLQSSEERTILEDITSNQFIKKGSRFSVVLGQKDFDNIEALQFGLRFSQEKLNVIHVNSTLSGFNSDNYHFNNEEGFCNILWFDAIEKSKNLKITLTLVATDDINIGETIFDLGKGTIPTVFYESQGAVASIPFESKVTLEGENKLVVNNPIHDNIVVFIPTLEDNTEVQLELFKSDGSLVLSQKGVVNGEQFIVNNSEIAVLASGTYFVRVISGNTTFSKSLIKI
jgi:hypothetical protein